MNKKATTVPAKFAASHSELEMPLSQWPSHVLQARGRHYYWQGAGPLSIKTFFHGQALYDAGGGRFAVDDDSYLILNHAQPYSITIDVEATEQAVESFCLFFQVGFVEEVQRSLRHATEMLLDRPFASDTSPLCFYERTYRHDTTLSPALFHLRKAVSDDACEIAWLEERFHDIVARLLRVQHLARAEQEALPAIRAATREELYRRLHRARDYAAASLEQPLSLAELATVACLSPNHLLRTFKQAFGQTPHQYVTAKRLERVQKRLLLTEDSVTEICFDIGFESLASFSRLFRHHVGLSPQQYRQQRRAKR